MTTGTLNTPRPPVRRTQEVQSNMTSVDETGDPFVSPSWKSWHDDRRQQIQQWEQRQLLRIGSPDEFLADTCTDDRPHRPALTATLNRRGVKMIYVKCWVCEKYVHNIISHQIVRERFHTDPDNVPVTRSNACKRCDGDGCPTCCPTPCARCRRHTHTHEHHTAPRALFPDANHWPIVALCQQCHSHWHSIMTPGMTRTPHPVAEHLRDEWEHYKNALDTRDWNCDCRHGWPWEPCSDCQDNQHIIDQFETKYHTTLSERLSRLSTYS